jgi:hypothetical protein
MSVDFVLPESSGFDTGATVYVPLMLLKKRDLRNFDLRDEQGGALILLETRENAALAARAIRRYLSAYGPVNEKQAALIERIVSERDAGLAGPALEPGGHLRPVVDAVPAGRNRKYVEALIRQLDEAFLVLVGVAYEAGARRVLKFSYDVEHRTGYDANFLTRLYFSAARFFSSFGLVARVERFEELVVGLGASYHAEAVPPADTYVEDARLEIGDQTPIVDGHRFRPHVHGESKSRGDRGTFTLLVHARREGLVLPLLFAALAITGTLALVPRQAEHLDGQTLGALLLVPFALAAFFIRSAENSYVTQMLRGVRLAALVPVAAAVLTIAMLGLGYLDPPGSAITSKKAKDVAELAAWASGAATAVLALAVIAPLVGRPVRGLVDRLALVASALSPKGRVILSLGITIASAAGGYGIGQLLQELIKAL